MFNKLKVFFMLSLIAFVSGVAYAQGAPESVPSSQEWQQFMQSLSGVGGAGWAGIVLLVVQGIMLVVRQFVQGKYKLLIVTGLTFVASIFAGFAAHQPVMASLLSAGALSSLQVFIHQIVAQFTGEKK